MAFKDKSAENKYKNDYTRMMYDRLSFIAGKEEGQMIRDSAAAVGQSVSAYILQAVRERMEKERAQ